MPDPETVSEALEQSTLDGVRRVSTGNVSVEGHSLRELIEADKYNRTKDADAASTVRRGLRFAVQNPPGGGG